MVLQALQDGGLQGRMHVPFLLSLLSSRCYGLQGRRQQKLPLHLDHEHVAAKQREYSSQRATAPSVYAVGMLCNTVLHLSDSKDD